MKMLRKMTASLLAMLMLFGGIVFASQPHTQGLDSTYLEALSAYDANSRSAMIRAITQSDCCGDKAAGSHILHTSAANTGSRVWHINSEEIDSLMLELSEYVTDVKEVLSAFVNPEDINQIMLEFSEREEIFVEVANIEEMLSFPKNPDYRYTFIMPLEDSDYRIAPLSNCFRCGQRVTRFRMLRQLTAWAITCPASGTNTDHASIFQDAEIEGCPPGCTFRIVSLFGPEINLVDCFATEFTIRHRVRPWQFWMDFGFNPHECWHIFNRGSIWDRVPFWR